MGSAFDGILDRYSLASSEFRRRLETVRADQWAGPTPCTEWNVRQLVNNMTRGNLNFAGLLNGGTAAEFLRLRGADALGADPLAAYTRSVQECAEAFARPGALQQVVDYPLGRVPGEQALAIRTTDSTIHTWDLARALGADDTLSPDLVAWIGDHIEDIYAGLVETPTATETTHRFFALPCPDPRRGSPARTSSCAAWAGTLSHLTRSATHRIGSALRSQWPLITKVTKLRATRPTRPVTCQQPSAGKFTPDALNPVSP